VGPRNHVLDQGVQIAPCQKAIFRGNDMPGHVRWATTLSWAVQQWLNQSRCPLGCGLRWA